MSNKFEKRGTVENDDEIIIKQVEGGTVESDGEDTVDVYPTEKKKKEMKMKKFT